MALWGNNDNLSVQSGYGVFELRYLEVQGTGTTLERRYAGTGSIIRFGVRNGDDFGGISTYFGDAVVVGVASTTSLTIGSTANLTGGAIGNTSFTVSECPKSTILNSHYSNKVAVGGTTDKFVYGISTTGSQEAAGTAFETGVGWVGIQTYKDNEGNLRVKKEILVAMSGISTGNVPKFPDQK
ncbi:MAG: hypothetical protein CM15mV24_1400 [Bellamyvirus sp.]|nr:MAG: hypothetical protein CM15mV24_1400 [Bellamyvirus sp.]